MYGNIFYVSHTGAVLMMVSCPTREDYQNALTEASRWVETEPGEVSVHAEPIAEEAAA